MKNPNQSWENFFQVMRYDLDMQKNVEGQKVYQREITGQKERLTWWTGEGMAMGS